MSDTESEFITCPCNTCAGKIQFERALFDPAASAVVTCPHCGLETTLHIPSIPVANPVPTLPPPIPIPPVNSPANAHEIFKSLSERARKGDCESQYLLGIAFLNGDGVAQDYAQGLEWIRHSAERGYHKAQCCMAEFHLRFDNNHDEAIRLYRLAAEQGNADAQFALGLIYGLGQSGPKDSAEAVKWYRLAAEQGHPAARNSLGVAYDHGEGVPRDNVEAAKWYYLAAEQGEADAHGQLGTFLL